MADAPSNSELAWRLDEIRQLLQGLVSRAEYSADQRAAEHRFTELERDIVAVDEKHDKAVAQILEQLKEKGNNTRQFFYAGVIPAIAILVAALVTLLVSGK